MPPPVVLPVVASLRPTDTSVVHGCPGVPRSIPRIDTVVELRSATGAPFRIRSVSIELRTFQKVSIPSTLGSNDTQRDYKVYGEPFAYRPVVGEFHDVVLGMDIPVLIPLPKDIVSSGSFPNWNASTTHNLCVRVACGDTVDTEVTYIEMFPIAIKVYDTLPLYRQYNEPLLETTTSSDRQVVVDITLPVSAVGPRDNLTVITRTAANAGNRRIKKNLAISKLTLQIQEILECHEGGLPARKENKLYTNSTVYAENGALDTNGIHHQFDLEFPVDNDYLLLFKDSQPMQYQDEDNAEPSFIQSINISRHKSIERLEEGVPITHTQGFTTMGKLFLLRYELALKLKLVHAKDIEVRLPIVVSPYDRSSSNYLLQWIMKECEVAVHKYGIYLVNRLLASNNYDDAVHALRRYRPPPVVYKYTKADWVRLGYNAEAYGLNRLGKNLVQYID